MAIIRNDRRARESAEHQEADPEEEVDYSWHPSDEEFPDPISADRWLVMLDDPTVFDEDGLRAVKCVEDYGEPVTFQQLSVRYRGTMGRYRRWLNGVAERAALHEGREPFGTDASGALQWWPYLYRQRIAGKVTANVHEMVLRPELSEALRRRAASSKERQREQEQAQAVADARRRAQERKERLEAAVRAQAGQASAAGQAQQAPVVQVPRKEVTATIVQPQESPVVPVVTPPSPTVSVPASRTAGGYASVGLFLEVMASLEPEGQRRAKGPSRAKAPSRGEKRVRLDYARIYSERLYDLIDLMGAGLPGLTVAQVARELGDESVERLQGYLNAEAIPSFAYLSRVCDLLFVEGRWLDSPSSLAQDLPVFCTYRDRHGSLVDVLEDRPPQEVVFVTDDGPGRRSGVILRLSELCYVLLDRHPVSADADRYTDPGLSAYVRLARDMDDLAHRTGLLTRSLKVPAATWDALAAGRLWPGTPCLLG